MKKFLVVVGLLVLASSAAMAQGTYFVDYFSNNAGPVIGPVDQTIKIINVGTTGTPLSTPRGDVCANIYVFDNNQEMIACCPCRLTPNELASTSVGFRLTNNPITSVVPPSGVIKIVASTAPFLGGGTGACSPINPIVGADASVVRVFATHIQVTGGASYITETEKLPSPLSADEAGFLPLACTFTQYLGSGKGTCSCLAPGR